MRAVLDIVLIVLDLYVWLLIASAILSWLIAFNVLNTRNQFVSTDMNQPMAALPLVERLGRLFTALAGGVTDGLEITYEGEIADYDCRVLTLGVLKGLLAPVVDEPVTFVNAPQLAEERGVVIRETKLSSARDYVNLVELRGRGGGRETQVAGTLYGKRASPRIGSGNKPRATASCCRPPAIPTRMPSFANWHAASTMARVSIIARPRPTSQPMAMVPTRKASRSGSSRGSVSSSPESTGGSSPRR